MCVYDIHVYLLACFRTTYLYRIMVSSNAIKDILCTGFMLSIGEEGIIGYYICIMIPDYSLLANAGFSDPPDIHPHQSMGKAYSIPDTA